MRFAFSQKISTQRPAGSFRYWALSAAILSFMTIAMGGILRATGASGACGGWPLCSGSLLPPPNTQTWLDFSHRLLTLALFPVNIGLWLAAWKEYRHVRRVFWPVVASLALFVLQVVVGGLVVLGIPVPPPALTAFHLGLSLFVLGLVSYLSVVSFYTAHYHSSNSDAQTNPWSFRSPFSRLSLWTLLAVFALLVSGALVSAASASTACSSWPLCNPSALLPVTLDGWLNMTHRLVVGLASILVVTLFIQSWRTQRSQTPILVASTAATVLFISQALLGWLRVAQHFPLYMIALHEATAVAVWGALVVLVTAVGMAGRTAQAEQMEAATWKDRSGLWKDFLALTKPIVVLLLLVTTFAGMVIGKQAWPSLSLVFWTLLGGFMAAGGSGAINQYIDRADDQAMQRTQKRPIPSGRMTPAEGLAFGVGIALASFYLMVAFVNLLSALLLLAGIFYYTLLYSIFLKKTTVQNIVIGGGAGAIPPLVGWAAATGSLNIPSLFLFAVVFLWTPPHFWALAIVRRKDYARAGVPMLPVIRGDRETRWQIFLYTLELVGLTLFLPLFGLGGSIYIISAVLLGGWLLLAAYRVWKTEGNKVAWKMYRYSSMYLAFLFLALMVDRLILH